MKMKMFKKKKKCSVCGYRFTPQKEEIYTAEEPRSFTECLSKPPTHFSAVDCPCCGCQIPLATRIPRVSLSNITEQDDMEESEGVQE